MTDRKPVARLLKWIGKDPYPARCGLIARSYDELPDGAHADVWEKVEELYTGEDRALYIHAAPCKRCEGLEAELHLQACLTRDLLPYQEEAVKSRTELAALEARNAELEEDRNTWKERAEFSYQQRNQLEAKLQRARR